MIQVVKKQKKAILHVRKKSSKSLKNAKELID